MEQLWGTIQYPVYLILALAAIAGIMYGINYARTQKKLKWLAWAAENAYGQAERLGHEYLSGKDDQGTAKFKKAMERLEAMAKQYGINFESDVLAGAIQLAWQKWEGQHKLKAEKAQVQQVVDEALAQTLGHNQ